MGKLADALAGLDADAIARVLRWAVDRYDVAVKDVASNGHSGAASGAGATPNGEQNGTTPTFSDLAELYDAAAPESEADKALVAGYWFQFCDGRADFGAQEVNTALKNLGHPIKNMTSAFDNLKARKPAPVLQLKKSGTTKQARKTYKLTVAGMNAVEMMIGPR